MTITLTREEAQQVLDAMQHARVFVTSREKIKQPEGSDLYNEAIETLRARLSQPESEPVAWTVGGLITDFSRDFSAYKTKTYTRPLYTAPPQREWQGLTDEEYAQLSQWAHIEIIERIEAKIREKNI